MVRSGHSCPWRWNILARSKWVLPQLKSQICWQQQVIGVWDLGSHRSAGENTSLQRASHKDQSTQCVMETHLCNIQYSCLMFLPYRAIIRENVKKNWSLNVTLKTNALSQLAYYRCKCVLMHCQNLYEISQYSQSNILFFVICTMIEWDVVILDDNLKLSSGRLHITLLRLINPDAKGTMIIRICINYVHGTMSKKTLISKICEQFFRSQVCW